MEPAVAAIPSRMRWVRRGVIAALLIAIGFTVIDVVDRVDWRGVWGALTQVLWWEVAVLFCLLVVKQVLNASPLAWFIAGLSVARATLNDQAGTLLSMVAPPPTDFVLRLRIFASWGIGRDSAVAGGVMNVLSYYTNRLLVPTLGLVLLALTSSVSAQDGLVAVVALAAGVALLSAVRVGVRNPTVAERIGTRSGRIVRRFRPAVDPRVWAASLVGLREHIAGRFSHAFPRSLLALLVMTLVDAYTLVLALRFAGVPQQVLPAGAVVGGFLVWFPLTILPFSGLGVLDAVLLALFTSGTGQPFEPEIVAALIVYRVVTLGGTALLGAGALLAWRCTKGRLAPSSLSSGELP